MSGKKRKKDRFLRPNVDSTSALVIQDADSVYWGRLHSRLSLSFARTLFRRGSRARGVRRVPCVDQIVVTWRLSRGEEKLRTPESTHNGSTMTRLLITPELKMLFRYSRKPSSFMSRSRVFPGGESQLNEQSHVSAIRFSLDLVTRSRRPRAPPCRRHNGFFWQKKKKKK
ncbi:hypothetical protein PUN28_002707 [Cardiocondyla obscurior]|uniref:Uncharacterized protein n=1 Tax=Cardiocondyla obscurior TaxID=286306 RepID=A0AAW2GVR5_9HYME